MPSAVTDVSSHIMLMTHRVSRPVCQPRLLVLQASLPPAPSSGHSDGRLGQHLGLPPSTAWYNNIYAHPKQSQTDAKIFITPPQISGPAG